MTVLGVDVEIEVPPGTTLAALRARFEEVTGPWPADWASVWELDGEPLAGAVVGMPPLLAGAVLPPSPGPVPVPRGGLEFSVVAGPRAGARFLLPPGTHVLGREGAVAVADPSVSRAHARFDVGRDGATVRDLGSLNGTDLLHAGGRTAVRDPVDLPAGTLVAVGDTVLRTGPVPVAAAVVRPDAAGHLLLNRPPRLLGDAPPQRWRWPVPEPAPQAPGLPVLALVVPLAVAGVLAVLWSPFSLLLGLASPVVAGGQWWTQRRRHRDLLERRSADLTAQRTRVGAEVGRALRGEHDVRSERHPDAAALLAAATRRGDRLFARSPGDPDHLTVRVGLGDRPAASATVEGEGAPSTLLRDVPVVVDLREGPVGVCGPGPDVAGCARWLLAQLAAHQSPSEVVLVTGPDAEWARWLPHHRPAPDGDVLAAPVAHVRARRERPGGPDVVVLLDPVGWWREDPRLAEVLTDGPALGVHTLCLGALVADLPTECRTVVDLAGGEVRSAQGSVPFRTDLVDEGWAEGFARALAPLRDAAGGAASAVPADVRLLDLVGPCAAADLVERWHTPVAGLPAVLGADAQGAVGVDLVVDGPHALLAGTTGSGKSVLLATLVTSLALAVPPEGLQFVLVDYKGGAAFGECVRLPHVAGLVTDLDDRLAGRVLRSLRAEVSRRERVLAAAGVADVRDLPAGTVPRLVVVVDEFRVLVQEVPEFVDGLVRLASVGRSLGVHLVLATQRPAGVVSPEVRANTDLRVALRVQDRADAEDVVGDPRPAGFSVPGRAVVRRSRSGSEGFAQEFQTARTRGPVAAGGARVRPVGTAPDREEVDDLPALVDAVRAAARGRRLPAVPWLPPLPDVVPAASCRSEQGLAWGLLDVPDRQCREVAVWDLDAGQHLLVAGGVRSGRTTLLRRLVVEAGHRGGGEVHVLDAGGGLRDLAGTGTTGSVVALAEVWRAGRLVERVQAEVDRRRSAGRWPGPVLLVVDGWEAWSAALTAADPAVGVDGLLRLLREGSGVGVRVVVAGDRQALTGAVAGAVGSVVLLRTADRADAALVGLRPADLPRAAPAGRGVLVVDGCGREVQVALPAAPAVGAPGATTLGVAALPARVEVERTGTGAGGTGLLLGRGGDDAGPVRVDPSPVLLVCGPAGSGRTQVLRTLAAAVADPVWARAVDAGTLAAALAAGRLVLVDDVSRPLPAGVEDLLVEALRGGGPLRLVVAGEGAELVGGFRGLPALARASARTTVLLGRDGRVPAEVLSRRPVAAPGPGPGAGFVVRDGVWTSVRVGVPRCAVTVAP